jgi:hypothetical protein
LQLLDRGAGLLKNMGGFFLRLNITPKKRFLIALRPRYLLSLSR